MSRKGWTAGITHTSGVVSRFMPSAAMRLCTTCAVVGNPSSLLEGNEGEVSRGFERKGEEDPEGRSWSAGNSKGYRPRRQYNTRATEDQSPVSFLALHHKRRIVFAAAAALPCLHQSASHSITRVLAARRHWSQGLLVSCVLACGAWC